MDRNIADDIHVQQIWQQMRNDGVSPYKIARIYHVSADTIRKCTTGKTTETISSELIKEVTQLRSRGFSLQQIVDELQIENPKCVYDILIKLQKKAIRDWAVPSGWVLNHPYQDELEPADRERYLEVVQKRRTRSPNSGYDYNNRQP